MKKKNIGIRVWSVVSVILVILLAALTVLENTLLAPILGTVLGGPKPINGENALDIYHSDYASKEEATKAGNALNVTISGEGFNLMWEDADAASPKDVTILRTAAKNILYTFANSNSIAVDIAGYSMEWWKLTTIIVDCTAVVGIALSGVLLLRKKKTA